MMNNRMFKYFICPICRKQLIDLTNPKEERDHEYWCDECDIYIDIVEKDVHHINGAKIIRIEKMKRYVNELEFEEQDKVLKTLVDYHSLHLSRDDVEFYWAIINGMNSKLYDLEMICKFEAKE